MTSVDVGDAFELTFTPAPGSDVTVSWYDPDGDAVFEGTPVTETPAASGAFPYTFLPTGPGTWSAVFTATGMSVAVERYYVRASALTGPPPLAVVGDVTGQFGTMTLAQETLTAALLRAASKMIRARFPQVDAQIADSRIDPDLVALAAANMVLRVLRNPGGLRAETVGPFSRTYDTGTAAGLLVLTAGEVSLLTPTAPAANSGLVVGTIRLKAGFPRYPGCGDVWSR